MTRISDQCVVCHQRITMSSWEPFCCEVCFDSADAEDRRLFENGLWDDLQEAQEDD